MAVTKVISGGQTGADQAGLYVAEALGIATGGWIPKGGRTDDGLDPGLIARFGMKEHGSPEYPPRTKLNIQESDGTVIFGEMGTRGCLLTVRWCGTYSKPMLVNPSGAELKTWLTNNEIQVLNVAGNRHRTNPLLFQHVIDVLTEALR